MSIQYSSIKMISTRKIKNYINNAIS